MRLNHYLASMVKSELDFIRENANFTEEESIVFEHMAKGKSIVYVANECNISTSTVSLRVDAIKQKLKKLERI